MLGVRPMNDDAKHRPLQVQNDATGSDGATAPRRKVWVAPKVIRSTLAGTAHALGSVTDGKGDHTISS